jgi:hypothetical protein
VREERTVVYGGDTKQTKNNSKFSGIHLLFLSHTPENSMRGKRIVTVLNRAPDICWIHFFVSIFRI